MGKKYRAGITDKRLNNRRFRKTEEAILKVFFEEDNYISLGKMADKVGIARSTIYRHHKTVREIVPDYQKYILRKYRYLMHKIKKGRLKVMYERMLLFMLQNRQIFEVLLKNGERGVLKSMIVIMEPEIVKYARLPKNYGKVFLVYMNEVVGLIEAWALDGFDEKKMRGLLVDVNYLTDTLRARLKGLTSEK